MNTSVTFGATSAYIPWISVSVSSMLAAAKTTSSTGSAAGSSVWGGGLGGLGRFRLRGSFRAAGRKNQGHGQCQEQSQGLLQVFHVITFLPCCSQDVFTTRGFTRNCR